MLFLQDELHRTRLRLDVLERHHQNLLLMQTWVNRCTCQCAKPNRGILLPLELPARNGLQNLKNFVSDNAFLRQALFRYSGRARQSPRQALYLDLLQSKCPSCPSLCKEGRGWGTAGHKASGLCSARRLNSTCREGRSRAGQLTKVGRDTNMPLSQLAKTIALPRLRSLWPASTR